jgi:protein-disulfide isomerase
MNRRGFLAGGLAVALAGCAGGDDGGSAGGPTPDGESLAGDAAGGDGLDAQPTRGPAPGSATATVVAFEDPSCPTCARFEREVMPDLVSEYVGPGTVSYVFRGYPVIYPWGEQGTRALEAVHERDPGAHWTLVDHYFQNQGRYRGEDAATVYDRTEAFLGEATDLDAAAVVDTARDGGADAAVDTDLSAGEAAGAGRTTPHLFLFRDGQFRTKSAGYTPLSTIEDVLEL